MVKRELSEMRKEVSGMEKNSQCGCEEHPVWAALDELGVEYERVEI
ncbi:Uncharacterised protein [Mycobacteroides abscessus subsp. abscessus]|nr:Uncharacterised protein [Mycobacteroides abscessus subsp. abscessus]SHZ45249.1 Uncharacterised protein [Mycobacteroides abscessus subsp. abscessus]SIB79811.1 Uncharacterised protein [Mycobacteroides abscessus subsp. abscessus]SIE55682.1 Uncharacterised protein [Mycobacteroides abscessus subsp. abscessus]SKI35922.1 Uncharacterised protein [Mycobacteroides abscessus subsp. abscessus]